MKITTKDGEAIEFEVAETYREPHSCTISVNAKGEFYGEVKCYGASVLDAFTHAELAMNDLKIYIDKMNNPHRLKD